MSLRNFDFLEKIGDGAYSTVWKVRRYTDKGTYALKKVRLSRLNEKEKRNALNEVRFLASIKNPYVISYKEAFFDDDSESLCIVMEYASDGDLYQKVQQCLKTGQHLQESFIWRLLVSMTQGLKALHDLNIMHRDLKTANVFLFKDSQVKLGDMNVSKVADEGLMHTQTGTPYYASPEVWKDTPYDTKSDIWSLGCVLYEACALSPPFKAEDMQGLFRKVTKGDYPSLPPLFSKELESVIAMMIQVDPRHRPSCDQILRLPIVARQNKNSELKTSHSSLIKAIPFPKELTGMSEKSRLPRSNYRERIKASEGFEDSYSVGRGHPHRPPPFALIREEYADLKLPKIKHPTPQVRRNAPKGLLKNRSVLQAVVVPRRGLVQPSWWG